MGENYWYWDINVNIAERIILRSSNILYIFYSKLTIQKVHICLYSTYSVISSHSINIVYYSSNNIHFMHHPVCSFYIYLNPVLRHYINSNMRWVNAPLYFSACWDHWVYHTLLSVSEDYSVASTVKEPCKWLTKMSLRSLIQ